MTTTLVAASVDTVRTTADVSSSSTSPVGVSLTELSMAVLSGATYNYEFYIIVRTSNSADGVAFGIDIPSSLFSGELRVPQSANSAFSEFQAPITGTGVVMTASSSFPGQNTNYLAIINGLIAPAADGSIVPIFSTEVSGTTVTVKAGSCGILNRVK